ncbi:ComEA family DNA-binding protein [Candidatus Omnitrophota bacterium]
MFSLTRQERGVVLFLVAVALAGIGINYLRKSHPRVKALASAEFSFDRININSADREALMSVSGIGEKLSERIIDYRQEHGGFRGTEEIKQVKGFGGYRYEKVKQYLTVE